MSDQRASEVAAVPERFVVRPWIDPVVEARGVPVGSIYTETVLLPILGPSTLLCLRRLGALAAARPDGAEVDTRQLARDLGLGDALARHSQMTKTLGRLCQFNMARWSGTELAVRTAVAPLPEHQLRRLSPELVGLHHCMLRHADSHASSSAGRASQRHSVTYPQPSPEPVVHAGSVAL